MAKILNNEFANAKITGVGHFTDNQIASIESTTPNLKPGAIYLILPQIAHAQPRTVNNPDGTTREVSSNRFGAIEIINGEVTGIVSVGVSALRATYLSDDADHKPELKMEIRKEGAAQGLFRPIAGQGMRIATLNSPAPLATKVVGDAKAVTMPVPFAFTVKGRKTYWQPIFKETADGRYDMETDDNMNAKVQQRRDYVLNVCEMPAGKYDLKSFIPQLTDYAL
jgi:hypothetical protein